MKFRKSWMAWLLSFFIIASCENAPSGDEAIIGNAQQATEAHGQIFEVDTADSHVRFTGHGVGKNHAGTFRLLEGMLGINGDQITGGRFVIDIRSMDLDDKGGIYDSKLRPHLMSGDFFDAEKFQTATFEITGVQPYRRENNGKSVVDGANYQVSGNFTLRDVTKNLTFPARIDLDKNSLRAKGNFNIDRTEWQMNYGNDKTLGDQFISETVNIEISLEAGRKQG